VPQFGQVRADPSVGGRIVGGVFESLITPRLSPESAAMATDKSGRPRSVGGPEPSAEPAQPRIG
jgi:hypothetical protein